MCFVSVLAWMCWPKSKITILMTKVLDVCRMLMVSRLWLANVSCVASTKNICLLVFVCG